MAAYQTLNTASNVDELVRRLGRVQPATARQWGTMTPHEMLCHLSDSFSAVLGERAASPNDTWFSRTVVKWVALHTSLTWPQGVPTRPEVNPRESGTKPVEFERDRTRVLELMQRFVRRDARRAHHPTFGALTLDEWMRWGYVHVDHHLRQFGL
jgi:uncharacterized protein DUF1569